MFQNILNKLILKIIKNYYFNIFLNKKTISISDAIKYQTSILWIVSFSEETIRNKGWALVILPGPLQRLSVSFPKTDTFLSDSFWV